MSSSSYKISIGMSSASNPSEEVISAFSGTKLTSCSFTLYELLEARPFTVRENARCQSFPDDWEFCGNVSAQYKQVGNAVPVNLAYEIGGEIIKSLKMGE